MRVPLLKLAGMVFFFGAGVPQPPWTGCGTT